MKLTLKQFFPRRNIKMHNWKDVNSTRTKTRQRDLRTTMSIIIYLLFIIYY
jgi:hypothetical protein